MKLLTSISALVVMTIALHMTAAASVREVAPLLSQLNGDNSVRAEFSYKTRMPLRSKTDGAPEATYIHARLNEAGTLASVVGDRLFEIDSIVVEGPVNDADFNTLWQGAYDGNLRIINIENAVVEGNKIPDNALFHIDEQVDWSDLSIYVTCLEKLMLPRHLDEIGKFAFAYTIHVTDIQWPADLKRIGDSAFTDNVSYSPARLIFPSTLEWIGDQTFYQCYKINGEVVLPEGLTRIYPAAFYQCRITGIEIPQTLEYLGAMAFYGSRFAEAYLPDNCYLGPEGAQFYNNYNLTAVRLPRNAEFVPDAICEGCMALTSVEMPVAAKYIDEFAFSGCKISGVNLGPALERIGMCAFQDCRLTTVILPETLKKIGDSAFHNCFQLGSIYCKAQTPPEHTPCYDGTFEGLTSSDKTDIPVYIPVGTRQLYQTASGWNRFTNLIETDNFPEAGVPTITADGTETSTPVYDLMGRPVATPQPGQIYIRNRTKILRQ